MYVSPRERAVSALAALAIMLGFALMLVLGLRVAGLAHGNATLVSLSLDSPEPPIPPPPRHKPRPSPKSAPKDAPAPPALRNKATQVVVPPPRIVLAPPPPIVVATQAGLGNATANGASDRPGPGQGAGGVGDGFGGGGNGGDGDGDGAVVGPRQIRGRLSFDDLPEGALAPGREARVGVRYRVEADGSVSTCRADEPSGVPAVDAMTCRLIVQRFRFRPARDRSGRPVPATIVEAHTWFIREEDGDRG